MSSNFDRPPNPKFHDQDKELKTFSVEITEEMKEALTQLGKHWFITRNKAAVLILDKFLQEAEEAGIIKKAKKSKS